MVPMSMCVLPCISSQFQLLSVPIYKSVLKVGEIEAWAGKRVEVRGNSSKWLWIGLLGKDPNKDNCGGASGGLSHNKNNEHFQASIIPEYQTHGLFL